MHNSSFILFRNVDKQFLRLKFAFFHFSRNRKGATLNTFVYSEVANKRIHFRLSAPVVVTRERSYNQFWRANSMLQIMSSIVKVSLLSFLNFFPSHLLQTYKTHPVPITLSLLHQNLVL